MKGKGKTLLFYGIAFVVLLAIGMGLWLLGKRNPPAYGEKPVIYLYPEEKMQVTVKLDVYKRQKPRCWKMAAPSAATTSLGRNSSSKGIFQVTLWCQASSSVR